ncbi:MAG: hypothetical protein BWY09_01772 [Candidatus Hydrogenedentes bacterium ADurb.Bin179]|nr:MAG: hypothetical protein BWY09_01772 [Candidatus Hydrogenedentes bacterium ADurb.Bin179]
MWLHGQGNGRKYGLCRHRFRHGRIFGYSVRNRGQVSAQSIHGVWFRFRDRPYETAQGFGIRSGCYICYTATRCRPSVLGNGGHQVINVVILQEVEHITLGRKPRQVADNNFPGTWHPAQDVHDIPRIAGAWFVIVWQNVGLPEFYK